MSEKDITIKQKQAKRTKAVVAKKKINTKSNKKRTEKQELTNADAVDNQTVVTKKIQKRKLNLERLDLIAKKMQEIRKKSPKSKV